MEVSELENLIKQYSIAYYSGNPRVDDATFDSLVDKLRKLNPNSLVLNTGWGFEVNGDKVKHKYTHIGSLDKCKSYEEIPDRFKHKKIFLSPKLDGLSAVAYFRNGELVQGITRGNGEYGKDITDKLTTILGCKYISDSTFTGAVTITSGVNLKFNKIQVPVSSGSSTYSNGNKGQVLKSNGTTVYWAADDNTDADSKTSSSNTTSKIYLVGANSQSSAGQTTYSNSSCYASGGYLYSNGGKVDMDNISGGVEWTTF